MNCTYAISGKWASNLFLKVSTDEALQAQRRGQVVVTPNRVWQDGKADRGGEPGNQEELGARARECDKKQQKSEKSQPLHL